MIYLLFSFFPIGIVLILIILYNIEGRIINFYNKNLNYFISEKYKVNIEINKKIKRWKIEAIIITILFFLLLIFISIPIFYEVKIEKLNLKNIIPGITLGSAFIFIHLLINTLMWVDIRRIIRKLNLYSKSFKNTKYENYFLDFSEIKISDSKKMIVHNYIVIDNMNIYYLINPFNAHSLIYLPSYSKIKERLNKIENYDDKIAYIDSTLCSEPLTLKIDNEYLDREQISYLRYLIINSIRK